MSYAQTPTWRYMNAAGTDLLWNEPTNWSAGVAPVNGDLIGVWNPTLSMNLNVDFTANIFQNSDTRTVDLTLGGANTLTVDVAAKSNFGENTAKGIRHWTTTATSLIIDCPVIVNNSLSESGAVYDDWTSFKIEGDIGNIIEFGANSSLDLAGEGGTGLYGNAIGEFKLNGSLSGSQVLGVGANTKVTFGATFVNDQFTGGVTVYSGANIIVDAPEGVKFSNKKLQANGSGTVTLNNANVIGKEIAVQGASELTINVNANQSLSHITFTNSADGTLTLNIDDSVTGLGFWKNHAKDWGTGTINIVGYKEGILNFGSNNSPAGLTAQQLSQIKINGQIPVSDPLSIDGTGHLVGASDLILSSNSYHAVDLLTYPNPVIDVLTIETASILQKVQLANLMGQIVYSSSDNLETINMQAFNSGVYVLTVVGKNGGTSTQRIVKN